MATDSAMETVFDHFHARRRHDIEAVASNLDPEVVHQGVQPELVCNGRDEVLAMVRRSFNRTASELDRIELVNAGDRVVVGLAGASFRENPFLSGELFIVFTVRGGTIVRMDDYRTRGEAFRAAGLLPNT